MVKKRRKTAERGGRLEGPKVAMVMAVKGSYTYRGVSAVAAVQGGA